MKQAVFCADIGTSSLKAAFISPNGEIFSSTTCRFNALTNSDRWLNAIIQSFNQLQENINSQIEILAIAISGNGPSLANSKGSYLWNEKIDNELIKNDLDKIAPQFSIFLPRILYLKNTKSEMWLCNEQIFSVPEYVVYQLTGIANTILPEERFRAAYWTSNNLDVLDIPSEKLPQIKHIGTSSGILLSSIAQKINITQKKEIPVFCTGPDFTIALIGSNTLEAGKICDRAGTSEGLNLCTRVPLKDIKIRTLPSPKSDLWNASIIIPDSGQRFSFWRYENQFSNISYEQCVKQLLENRNSNGYRLIKNIALEVKEAFEYIKTCAKTNNLEVKNEIWCTGGQAKNPLWMQMKTDILGVPFIVGKCPDAELLGNAIVALFGLGYYASIENAACELVQPGKIYYPSKTGNQY